MSVASAITAGVRSAQRKPQRRLPNVFHQPIGQVGPAAQFPQAAAQAGRAAARTASHFAGAPRPAIVPQIARPTHQQKLAAHRVRVQAKVRQQQFQQGAQASARQVLAPKPQTTIQPHGHYIPPSFMGAHRAEPTTIGAGGRPLKLKPTNFSLSRGFSAILRGLDKISQHAVSGQQPGGPTTATDRAITGLVTHPGRALAGIGKYSRQYAAASSLPGTRQVKGVPNIDQEKLFVETPRALFEHPGAIPKTLKGVAELPLAAPAGVVKAVTDPVGTFKAFSADTQRRYGGSTAAYRKRIGKEGAAPELTDALTILAPSGAGVGRGITKAVTEMAPGSRAARFLSEPRPALRTSGNTTRQQELSGNAFRATMQRFEDRARQAKVARRNAKHPEAKPGLQPRQPTAAQPERQVLRPTPNATNPERGHQIIAQHGGYRQAVQALHPDRNPSAQAAIDFRDVQAAHHGVKVPQQRVIVPPVPADRGEVAPLFQNRAMRVEQSKIQSRGYQGLKHEQGVELSRGVEKEIRGLNKHEQQGIFHALHGIVPLDNVDQAVAELTRRRNEITAAYRDRGFKGQPREAALIDEILKAPGKVFTPKLAEFHAQQLARAERVGHAGVSGPVAEARRYRPVADHLGIEYPYEVLRDQIARTYKGRLKAAPDANAAKALKDEQARKLADLEAQRPQLDRQFVAEMKRTVKEKGLPDPVYVQHFKHRSEVVGRQARTVGGQMARPGVKQSAMELFRTGRADTSPHAVVQSFARVIARRRNHKLMADEVNAHALPNPSPAELEQIFGHKHVDPRQLTADEWKTVIGPDGRGLNPNDWVVWSPGRFRNELAHAASADEFHHAAAEGAHDAVEVKGAVENSTAPLAQATDKFGREQGVRVIPRAVHDEIHSAVKGSNTIGRLADKLQGLQSTAILGTSLSWVQIQPAANLFVSAAAMRGNLVNFLRSPVFWKRVGPEGRQVVDEMFGTGGLEAHGRIPKLGAATNSRFVDGYRALREALGLKVAAAKNAVPLVRSLPTLNPIHLMFSFDNFQNRQFARTVLYDSMRRQAFKDMAESGGQMFAAQARLAHILNMDPEGRIQAMIDDPALFEKHANHAFDFLGNYTRYTATERRYLKRNIIFYGFFRYSMRMLFYTMPVKHPIMAAVGAKLAQLHVKEVQDLLGKGAPTWDLSQFYFDHFDKNTGKWLKDSAGKAPPEGVGLLRLNPVANPVVDVTTTGKLSNLLGFLSPAFVIALDETYGVNSFTGKPFRVEGSSQENLSPPWSDKGRIALNQILSLVTPYRIAEQATQPGTQGDDTLLGSPRPIRYKSAQAKAAQKAKLKAKGSPLTILEQQLEPFLSRPVIVGKPPKKKGKSKRGGGGNLFHGSGGGGGGAGHAPGSF